MERPTKGRLANPSHNPYRILSQRRQPHPFRPEDRFVFISERTGDLIQVSSLKTAIGRMTNTAQAEADRLGIHLTGFTFHDIKRKVVIAIGLKNYLFVDTEQAGKRAAAIQSLLGTAKLNGLDPAAWLKDTLEKLPT
jgi:IS66 C-terminal element